MDEFYRAEEMARVLAMLGDDPTITAVTFKQITFWGGLDYKVDGWYLRRGATYYHRLFKWGRGYSYATHRPPTVLDDQGRNLRGLHWIDGETLAARDIHLYHYSLLLPKQVMEKCDYYANAEWARRAGAVQWAQDAFLSLRRPFRVHNVYNFLSWLERYSGPHPDQIQTMVHDMRTGGVSGVSLRETADIERLLASPWYNLGRWIVQRLDPVDFRLRRIRRRLMSARVAWLPTMIRRAAPKLFD